MTQLTTIAITRRSIAIGAFVLVSVLLAWAATSSASAAKRVASYVGNPTSTTGAGPGQFGTGVSGVAVNDTGAGGVGAGDSYVVDKGNNRVQRFSSAGAFQAQFGSAGAGAGQFSTPQGVAIDQTTGAVYVTDTGNRRVAVYSATGTFQGAWGWGVVNGTAALQFCTTTCVAGLAGGGAGQFATTFSGNPAVAPAGAPNAGHVIVADPANRRVQEFAVTFLAGIATGTSFVRTFGFDVITDGSASDPTGVQTFQVCTVAADCKAGAAGGAAVGQFGASAPTRVAVDAAGAIYTSEVGINFRVQRFSPAGSSLAPEVFAASVLSGTSTGNGPGDIAVDPGTNDLLVSQGFVAGSATCPQRSASIAERRILEVSAAGALVDAHMLCAGINATTGLAVRSSAATGDIYVSSSTDGQRVYRLTTAGAAEPVAAVAPTSAIAGHAATLNGTVDPTGTQFTTGYHFEYSKDGGAWSWAPVPDANAGNGSGALPVAQPAAGLEANQAYRVRLVATKQYNAASAVSEEDTFTTQSLPPESVATLPATVIRSASARLGGRFDANNLPATFRFEYGTDASYGSVSPASRVDSGTATRVTADLADLAPSTVYHFRIVVSTDQGSADGGDQTFTTGGVAVAGPAGRVYELVTPPRKATRRGGLNTPDGYSALPALASPEGNSLLISLPYGLLADAEASFADDPNRLVRHADGWVTQPIYNHPLSGSVGLALARVKGTSTDQARQVWEQSQGGVFPQQEAFSAITNVRYMDGEPSWATPPGWTATSGWSPLSTAADQSIGSVQPQAALFTDDGRYLVRGAYTRGLAGPLDASQGQLAGLSGGGTIYRQDLGDGTFELLNTCTGEGEAATVIPERVGTGSSAADTIGSQPCAAGALTSSRGAALGGGNRTFVASTAGSMVGTAANAVTNTPGHSGDQAIFTSPDPTPSAPPNACQTGAGASTNCPPQLYVRRWTADGTARVAWISRSRQPDGQMISGQVVGLMGRGAVYEGAAKDGSVIYFRSNAPLTPDDPNRGSSITTGTASPNSWDLYAYTLPHDPDADPGSGTLTRISGGPDGTADPNTNCSSLGTGAQTGNCWYSATAGAAAGGGAAVRQLSDDGTKVYFVAAAPIAGADNAPPAGGSPDNVPGGAVVNAATRNLYLFDSAKAGAARWKFVARLPFSTSTLDGCATAYTTKGGPLVATDRVLGVRATSCMGGTADGSTIAFMTSARLTPDDSDVAQDIYAYDAVRDQLSRVSAPQGGTGASYTCVSGGGVQCNADTGFTSSMGLEELSAGPGGLGQQNVGADGSVYFESRGSLVPQDVNGARMDTYRWKDGVLSLISPGDTDDDAYFSGNGASGRDVFFQTTQAIDPREIEVGDMDIYDARVGGGFPYTPPAPPDDCPPGDDSCQGRPAAPPVVSPPGSTTPAAGNAPSPPQPTVVHAIALSKLKASARKRWATTGQVSLSVKVVGGGTLKAVASGRASGRTRVLASATRRVRQVSATSATVKLKLKLNANARGQLRRTGRLRLTLAVSLTGARTTKTTLTLTATKKRG